MNLPNYAEPMPPSPPPRVDLRVDASGHYSLDGRVLDAKSLRSAFDSIAKVAPDTVVHVTAAADSEYQGFATALAAAQDSGLANVALDD